MGERKRKGGEREKEERGREIRARSAARGRPRAAPITLARSGACAAGGVRGSRANRVIDSGVGVRSFRDREIGRKNSELNDEHLVLKLIIARFNLADFWDVTPKYLVTKLSYELNLSI